MYNNVEYCQLSTFTHLNMFEISIPKSFVKSRCYSYLRIAGITYVHPI